jgi:2-polyprenyl-6-methoxyphenol hydroxylase-like FAD-dependent oxidoreductase
MTGQEKEWVLLFEKRNFQSEDSHKYSPDEVIQFAANFSKLPASLDQTVGDMFARRTTAGMTDLDESMVEHWYSGRMVLVGDACHKMTPNAGLGFNNGVQDAVVLCNNLRNLLKDSPMSNPRSDAITDVFERYQSTRQAAARKDVTISMHFTRIQAWANWAYCLLARWTLPYRFMQRLSARHMCLGFSIGQVASYLPGKDLFSGNMAWSNTFRKSECCCMSRRGCMQL